MTMRQQDNREGNAGVLGSLGIGFVIGAAFALSTCMQDPQRGGGAGRHASEHPTARHLAD